MFVSVFLSEIRRASVRYLISYCKKDNVTFHVSEIGNGYRDYNGKDHNLYFQDG